MQEMIKSVILQMVRMKNPELAARAEENLHKYSHDQAGLQKLIAEQGGNAFVDAAINFAQTHPTIKSWMGRFGVNPNSLHGIRDQVMKGLPASTAHPRKVANNSVSSYQERLNRLK